MDTGRDGVIGRKGHARTEEALRTLLEEGRRAENAGVLDRAEAVYKEIADHAPTPKLAAEVLLRRSHVHRSWGMSAEAIRLAQQGRSLARQADERALEAELLNAEGAVHQSRGDFEEADRLFGSMLALTDNPRVRGIALQNLGSNAAIRCNYEEAERCFRESSVLFARAGYGRGEAFSLNNQGRVLLDKGSSGDAVPVLERAVGLANRLQDLDLHALATMNLAEALLSLGMLDQAEARATQALGYFINADVPWRTVDCLRIQGDISVRKREEPEALRCYERALQIADALEAKVEAEDLRRRIDGLRREASDGTS